MLEELGLDDGPVRLVVRCAHQRSQDGLHGRVLVLYSGNFVHRRREVDLDALRQAFDLRRGARPDEGRQVITKRRRRREHALLAGAFWCQVGR